MLQHKFESAQVKKGKIEQASIYLNRRNSIYSLGLRCVSVLNYKQIIRIQMGYFFQITSKEHPLAYCMKSYLIYLSGQLNFLYHLVEITVKLVKMSITSSGQNFKNTFHFASLFEKIYS